MQLPLIVIAFHTSPDAPEEKCLFRRNRLHELSHALPEIYESFMHAPLKSVEHFRFSATYAGHADCPFAPALWSDVTLTGDFIRIVRLDEEDARGNRMVVVYTPKGGKT